MKWFIPGPKIRTCRRGFTLTELVVSLGIIGLLFALLLPAIQQSRAASRRVKCASNLKQIGLAVHHYLDIYHQFPGAIHVSKGCLYTLLPFIDQEALYQRLENSVATSVEDSGTSMVAVYLCPDDPITREGVDVTSYAINGGIPPGLGPVHGFRFEIVTPAKVSDGLSQTAYMSEMVSNNWIPFLNMTTSPDIRHKLTRKELESFSEQCLLGAKSGLWQRGQSSASITSGGGYNHLLPPNSPICYFSPYPIQIRPAVGAHAEGLNVLMADGSVRFSSENIDRSVWWNLGTINGNDIVNR